MTRPCTALVAALSLACGPKGGDPRKAVAVAVPAHNDAVGAVSEARTYPWHSGARHYLATDPSGSPTEVWRVELGSPVVHPLQTDGTRAFATSRGSVSAIAADGTLAWTQAADSTGPIAVRSAGVATGTMDRVVLDLSHADGQPARSFVGGGTVTGAPVSLGGELVWVTEAGVLSSENGWEVQASDSALGSPASDDTRLFFATATAELVAARRTGVDWRVVLPGTVVDGLAVADGMVYAAYRGDGGSPAGLAAVAADSGTVAWRVPLSSDPVAGPAVGRVIAVATQTGQVLAFDPGTGNELWATELAGAPSTAPAFGRFGLYVGNADGRIHRLDPDDGGEVWSLQLGASVSGSPVLLDGLVVAGLADGSVVGVGGR